MNTTLLHHAKSATDAVSMGDVVALLGTAMELRRAALAGTPQRPLRGKNIALLAPSEALPAAVAMADAARALGATVVHVHPESLPPSDSAAFNETVGLLGRLYDAVMAEGLPAGLARRIEAAADRPVLDHVADSTRPLHALAGAIGRLEGASLPITPVEHHGWLLQAALVNAMA
ncbi:MAG: hypothetical protein ACM32J_07165 [Rhizobacter sp.]|jgi:ornithine carbamoyltransferase